MHHPDGFGAEIFSTCASGCTQCLENTPTICRFTPAGLESGPSKLKIVRVASSTRADVLHRRMMRRREHEADAGLGHAAADLIGREVDLDAEEASTSAAPEREDSARLPCLATGTPAPATMKDAQVETLTEPEPSPPVPTTSTASAGAGPAASCRASPTPRR